MKKLAIVTALAIGLVAGTALADGHCGRHGHHGKRFGKWLQKAGVAADVIQKIRDLKKEWKASKKDAWKKMKARRKELREALSAATLDDAKIDGIAGELAQMKAEMVKGRIGFFKKVAALLTAEQRAALAKHLARRHEGCRCGKKGKHHGDQ